MLISVITPTYDRAYTLEDAYRSLLEQRVELEWLVVDDGSADETRDLIAHLSANAPFPVRYELQEHAGAHAARNRGVRGARGEMVALLDADDLFVPGGLDRMAGHWSRIADPERYAGVSGLCVDETGAVIGDRFPARVLDATWQEMTYRFHVRGEKSGLVRTDVLRACPFPTEPLGLAAEAAVWRELGRHYRVRHVNEPVRVHRLGAAERISRRPFGANAGSLAIAHASVLNEDAAWFRHAPAAFARSAVHLTRGLCHQGVPLREQPERLRSWPARMLWGLALPFGWALYRRDLRAARDSAQRW
ncbi:MAG: glycosyl transferase [Streptosporangiaceae bacterium]|jgi:glycosyltransferase involved in cell wall biosynthesis|nr:glycosyl transferase [Streptosporangiaceae bacterium]